MSLGQGFVSITPSDTVDVPRDANGDFPSALYVGVTGNVSVVGADGSSAVLQNVAAGIPLPVRVRRVNATGTTATGLVGIYL